MSYEILIAVAIIGSIAVLLYFVGGDDDDWYY